MYISIVFAITLMLNTGHCDCLLAMKSNRVSNVLNPSRLGYRRQIYEYTHHVKWLCFNSSDSEFDCCMIKYIHCLESGPALPFGYCATYNETKTAVTTSKCPYLEWNDYNVTTPWFISLPVSLTELNDYMCGPQNRKGLVCSECADGFGPSVTSSGYKCAKCDNAWYHVPLFLLVQILPSTILYIIVLVFRISVVSPPLPCFIICTQLFVLGFDTSIFTQRSSSFLDHEMFFTKYGTFRLDMKIIHIIYSFFNQLDIVRYVLPPTCLNSKLKQIHVYFFSYISVFYPIFLIILTWVCVNLHNNNVRLFVWLWRQFHKCIFRLRRKWDIKSDLVDAFITFFLLSYMKSAYQAAILLVYSPIKTMDKSGCAHLKHYSLVDPSIEYFGYTHLPFAVIALCLTSIFNILPPLLLILYPFGVFRSLLSRCRLDYVALNIFAEKLHCYYKNGLDGGRDMRYFAGLYLYLWIGLNLITIAFLKVAFHYHNIWLSIAVSFQIMAIVLVIAKPYQKMYMNYMDALLLLCISLQFFSMSSGAFQIARVLISIPIIGLILMIIIKFLKKYLLSFKASLQKCCRFCSLRMQHLDRDMESIHSDKHEVPSPEALQPLIQPTPSEVNYNSL